MNKCLEEQGFRLTFVFFIEEIQHLFGVHCRPVVWAVPRSIIYTYMQPKDYNIIATYSVEHIEYTHQAALGRYLEILVSSLWPLFFSNTDNLYGVIMQCIISVPQRVCHIEAMEIQVPVAKASFFFIILYSFNVTMYMVHPY